MKKITQLTLVFLLLSAIQVTAQDAKKLYKAGKKFAKENQFKEAIEQYNAAIKADGKYVEAYVGRAEAYESTNHMDKAVEDYKVVFTLLPPTEKELKDYYFHAGNDLVIINKYKDAIADYDKAIAMDKSFLKAMQQRAFCKIKIKDFAGAVEDCDKAIGMNSSDFVTYFYKGIATDSLGSYQISETLYQKAVNNMLDQKSKKDPIEYIYKPYYVNLGTVQRRLNKLDEAMKNYNFGLALDPNDDNIYTLRGIVYFLKGDYPTALIDYKKAIVLNEKNASAFLERGFAYKKQGEYQNAITDFTHSIVLNDNEPRNYVGRASCYFEIAKYTEAMKDYEKALILLPNDKELKAQVESTKKKIFEINRESNVPVIVLQSPESDLKNRINIPDNKTEFEFKGKIKDESAIKYVKADGQEAEFNKEAINPSFTVRVAVSGKTQITVSTSDVYNNVTNEIYTIIKTETVPPLVKLTTPPSTPQNEIFLTGDSPTLFFEGQISDASNIKSITVDGLNTAFDPNIINPTFSTNVNVLNKDTIKIVATDSYGNTSVTKFFIDKAAAIAALKNPMGRTWAVFIDNSNYRNLPALQGTSADVSKMRASLAGYQISHTEYKKDMTKEQMDRYFNIELRDLLKSNLVNSVMIWYSGHGKFVNDVGYWLPVDATVGDEFSYYSLNNLKGAILGYKNVEHHLVISDACETGPAFYLAMRSADKPKNCGEWEAAKLKSAQVLTSSNKEKSSDNSVFATTFSSSLNGNQDACITIETIADRVKSAVKKNQTQSPKFGNINGIEDAGGTFFFIKK